MATRALQRSVASELFGRPWRDERSRVGSSFSPRLTRVATRIVFPADALGTRKYG